VGQGYFDLEWSFRRSIPLGVCEQVLHRIVPIFWDFELLSQPRVLDLQLVSNMTEEEGVEGAGW
jgi:hypothetical protein